MMGSGDCCHQEAIVSDNKNVWRIYPVEKKNNAPFHNGDICFLRSEKAGLECPTPHSMGQRVVLLEHCGKSCKVQVSNPDGKHEVKTVKKKRLLPIYDSTKLNNNLTVTTTVTASTVLIVKTTQSYRHMAISQLRQADTVDHEHILEIGCSTGETSCLLWRQLVYRNAQPRGSTGLSSWVGMDTSQFMVNAVTQRLGEFQNRCMKGSCGENDCKGKDNVTSNDLTTSKDHSFLTTHFSCVQVDPLLDPVKAKQAATLYTLSPTIVFLDIGGCREIQGVVRMIQWVLETFASSTNVDAKKARSPRLIVVKSERVYQAICNDCDPAGVFDNGSIWFRQQLQKARACLPSHPLQAAKQYSPMDATKMICRYHNYHESGCARHNDVMNHDNICPFDHEHCHACRQKGHVARHCPLLLPEKI